MIMSIQRPRRAVVDPPTAPKIRDAAPVTPEAPRTILEAPGARYLTVRRADRRAGRFATLDSPHLILHGDHAADDDRRERQNRPEGEGRNAGQSLADRAAQRRHAPESHQGGAR